MPSKYTKELLKPLVAQSTSMAGVLRLLGVRMTGGSYTHIKKRICVLEIDTSHFTGQKWLTGKRSPSRLKHTDILVKRSGYTRREGFRLRRALIEIGRSYQCEGCKHVGRWCDAELVLEVHHRNGDWLDDRAENLQFLCPNCHQQADRIVKSKTILHAKKINLLHCLHCHSSFSANRHDRKFCSSRCANLFNVVAHPRKTKIAWPDAATLETMLEDSSYMSVGRQLGVSDTSIRKRMVNKDCRSELHQDQ